MSAEAKRLAAERAVEFVKNGMKLGLGTGSTAEFAVRKIGALLKEGRLQNIQAIPTSEATRKLAEEMGVPLIDFSKTTSLDLTIDGADESDGDLNLIKGGGGALLREKIVAAASKEVLIVADASKLVKVLGAFPLPVEVVKFGWQSVAERIQKLGTKKVVLRQPTQTPFVTDNGNYVLDCHFQSIPNPKELDLQLNQIPGVVTNGLFIQLATHLILGQGGKTTIQERPKG